MSAVDFALFCEHSWIDNAFRPATVLIKADKIVRWETGRIPNANFPIEDLKSCYLMPGLIDAHVHINEPGRTDWEGFDTATKAAAAGGITTLVDMPLNSTPVSTSAKNLELKLAAAQNKLHVHCAYWGGFVPDSLQELKGLIQTGVLGIKVFLTHSGIDDFPNVSLEDLEKALPILQKEQAQLLIHCELDQVHEGQELLTQNPESYQAYLASRPKSWENDAVRMMIQFCRKYKIKTHIVHLSSADVLADIRAAKEEGLPLTVETCPQYLYFHAGMIPDRHTQFKCAPPIREKENNDLLWQALSDDLIDFIATDHSPAPPALKQIASGNFKEAWGGIAGLQNLLSVVWTAARKRSISIDKIPKWLSENPARFLNLNHRKGKIASGYDADLVVWKPQQQFELRAAMIHHKHKISPYIGEQLYGVVDRTYVSGQLVFHQDSFENLQQGKIILKHNI